MRTVKSFTAGSLHHCFTSVAAVCVAMIVGCGPTAEPAPAPAAGHESQAPASHDSEGGDDHAGHSHAGKYGGHVVVLNPGHVHAEFVHVDETETLEIYVDEIADKVTGVQVVVETAGQDPKTYELQKEESLGKAGYTVKDATLLTSIGMADGDQNKVTLNVMTTEGTLSASLVDDHGHDH